MSAFAAELARRGWMVVTGAGPGIMQAGMEGAGREASIGVSIRLPFETGANPVIAGDAKYVSMKYFFTRKLMLIKESAGFVCLPGGFGTLDETFELLTLTQTGKGVPVPIVLLDTPDDPYWEAVDTFIRDHLVARSMVDPDDVSLYRIRHDAEGVAAELESFYANFHSIRFVGDRLIIRLRDLPSPARLDDLRQQFAALSRGGVIEAVEPTAAEVADGDHLSLARLSIDYDARHAAGLRLLIDRLNAA
ncbi:MAG: LOG family protein [Gemmobacter sp.]